MAKAQVIKCKCGKIFAAAIEPHCYEDADWMRDMRKYVKRGCSVDLIESKDFEFEKCICEKEKTIVDSNQKQLFT